MRRVFPRIVLVVLAAACASKGDVRRLQEEFGAYRARAAREDSLQAAMLTMLLDDLARYQRQSDSILVRVLAELDGLSSRQGQLRGEITDVQRQIETTRELTGQSHQRINDLRERVEQMNAQSLVAATADSISSDGTLPPEELLALGRRQLQTGSPLTARVAFQRLIADHPTHPLVAEALYGTAESFAGTEHLDSAMVFFARVVAEHPRSDRAPTALYRIGLDAERRGDEESARVVFERVATEYTGTDEARLACQKLGRSC